MSKAKQIIEQFLKANHISNSFDREIIIDGFDLSMPIYENKLWAGDKIYQYVRRYSSNNLIKTGNWFSLKGASMSSLGIFGGDTGRQLTEYRVINTINVLEGTAREMNYDWKWAGGGVGGGTQIYIPTNSLFSLEAIGVRL